ncbi:hypothetical protein I551_5883 [Mycobacterium ulcerans str. Harvey]|uniref:Uncharacterized protein n=1 Tax=Mycobacterium ulcerans str. Harvey TaxID=1299332 RepID=A0ABP3A9T3_MYCUL|nr:hypothetical protein I551_5883 [Mycobacterium ulcerans str. Harvey]
MAEDGDLLVDEEVVEVVGEVTTCSGTTTRRPAPSKAPKISQTE